MHVYSRLTMVWGWVGSTLVVEYNIGTEYEHINLLKGKVA